MIFEHEIPAGSRLYFAESAKLKREIEFKSAKFLEERGYCEMVTPLFSYHQHESFGDIKHLIRLNDQSNHEVSLRADSTADVVRIATKRLGRSRDSKKWFYIQPVYSYPTKEQYQIGAENLDGDLNSIVDSAISLLNILDIKPLLQISNIAIPKLLSKKYGVDLKALKSMHISKIVSSEYPWIEDLIHMSSPKDLENLDIFPDDIAKELRDIAKIVRDIEYDNIVISPLYYASLRYYEHIVFRFFEDNRVFATGGNYNIGEVHGAGFALMTDACIATILQKEANVR